MMAGNNDETAQLSPEKMQLVMWEGKAFAFVGNLAEQDPGITFEEAWTRFCHESPIPELASADYDPDAQLKSTRAAAEQVFNDNR